MPKDNEHIKQRIAETLEMPKDVVMDFPKATIMGNIQVNIENHNGIIEYSDKTIRINTSIGVFKIEGNKMSIKYITLEEVVIVGVIYKVEILD